MRFLLDVLRHVIGLQCFLLDKSPALGTSTVLPSVSHSGILFEFSIHVCITVASFCHIFFSVFHQEFDVPPILGGDQFFLLLMVFRNSFSAIYVSSTCLSFSFILSLIFSIYFLLDVSLSSYHMHTQSFINLSIVGTLPLHFHLSFAFL